MDEDKEQDIYADIMDNIIGHASDNVENNLSCMAEEDFQLIENMLPDINTPADLEDKAEDALDTAISDSDPSMKYSKDKSARKHAKKAINLVQEVVDQED